MDEPRSAPDTETKTGIFLTLADQDNEKLDWLFGPASQYIARGKINLLFGDPGVSKSSLAYDLASRATRGKPWPDPAGEPSEPVSVILMSLEDGVGDTIRPRCEAAGGDLSKIHVLRGVGIPGKSATLDGKTVTVPPEQRMLNLQDDLTILRGGINKYKAGLVIIDPITAYMPTLNTSRDNEVRAVLTALELLAQETGVAIITVMHMNKDNQKSVIHRASGSVAFVAVPRMAFLIAPHPINFSATKEILFLPVKKSIATPEFCKGFGYQIVTKSVTNKKNVKIPDLALSLSAGLISQPAKRRMAASSQEPGGLTRVPVSRRPLLNGFCGILSKTGRCPSRSWKQPPKRTALAAPRLTARVLNWGLPLNRRGFKDHSMPNCRPC